MEFEGGEDGEENRACADRCRECRAELSSLERWAFECLQPYNPAFLEGMGIQRTQIDVTEGFATAKEMMAPALQAHIRAQIGGDRQRIDQLAAAFQDPVCCHLWLPVWVCSGRIKDKPFHLVVNATTGKIEGEVPYSGRKLLIAIGIAGAIMIGVSILLVLVAQ